MEPGKKGRPYGILALNCGNSRGTIQLFLGDIIEKLEGIALFGGGVSVQRGDPNAPSPMDRMTDASENITLHQTSFAGAVIMKQNDEMYQSKIISNCFRK